VVLSRDESIEEAQLSVRGTAAASSTDTAFAPGTPLRLVEKEHILRTLQACGGNRTEAARLLGIGRNTLTRKLKES
jgi:transcriptional regulator of acetoin/glycerol metabolism